MDPGGHPGCSALGANRPDSGFRRCESSGAFAGYLRVRFL